MNVINVIKRDGRIVPYDNNKVQNAICSAMACTSSGIDTDLSWKITEKIFDKVSSIGKDISVEDIQDMVEHSLMVSSRKDAAKEYIIYRNKRSSIRSNKSELIKQIGRKIMAIDVQNQNANVDEKSFGGRRGQAADIVLKEYALNNCMSELAKSNHVNNEIYIHDLNSYATGMHNCLSLPFDDLLANGFKTRQTDVRPANSINTAFQLVAVIFQLQSLNQFGGCSATHLDWTMVPYVRKSFYKHYIDGLKYAEGWGTEPINTPNENIKDLSIESPWYAPEFERAYNYAIEMTERELRQAVEGMYHNLNLLGRHSGNTMNIAV